MRPRAHLLPLLSLLPQLLLGWFSTAAPPIRQTSQEAAAALGSGNLVTAVDAYTKLVGWLPQAPSPRLRLGEALLRQGRENDALARLEEAAAMGAGADPALLERLSRTAGGKELAERFRRNVAPVVAGHVLFRIGEKDLIPESLAYDEKDRSFYVGSLYKQKIVRVARGAAGGDFAAADFVAPGRDGLWSVIGMKIDPAKRELWANSCNVAQQPVASRDGKTVGQAAVHRYELPSGRLVKRYLAPRAPLCFNDLVLSSTGDVFLTAGGDGVFRIRKGGETIEPFLPSESFANGIAVSDDGRRVFFSDDAAGVKIADVAGKRVTLLGVPAGVTLAGLDGLYVRGRTFVAVQNGLAHGPERVLEGRLDPTLSRLDCLSVLDRTHPEFAIPTTGVLVGDSFVYVAASQLGSFDEKGALRPERLREGAVLETKLRGCGR